MRNIITTVLSIMLVVLIVYYASNAIQFSLPLYLTQLSVTLATVGIIMSIANLIRVPVAFMSGIATKSYGRHKVLTVGCAMFAISILLLASCNIAIISLSRAILGISAAFFFPTIWMLVSDIAARTGATGRIISIGNAVSSFGMILAFASSGFIINLFGFRKFFLMIGILLLLLTLPLSRVAKRFSSEQLVKIGVAIRDCATLLKRRSFVLVLIATLIEMYVLYSWLTFTQIYMKNIGLSEALIGLVMSAEVATYAILQPLVGHIIDRLGLRSVLLLCTSPIYGLLLAYIPYTRTVLSLTLLMIGIALVSSPYVSTILYILTRMSSEKERDLAVSVLFTLIYVGIGLGQVLTGIIAEYSMTIAYLHLAIIISTLSIIGIVLYHNLQQR